MLAIKWHPAARDDLFAIIKFIAARNPSAARRMKSLIESAVLPIATHQNLFRPGRIPSTRELVAHPVYNVVYRVNPNEVEILNVLHARQQYP